MVFVVFTGRDNISNIMQLYTSAVYVGLPTIKPIIAKATAAIKTFLQKFQLSCCFFEAVSAISYRMV